MNKSCCAVVLVASTALAALSVEAELRASKVSESSRPYFSGASNEWSGITYAGNDLYYVVDDKDKKLYSLTMKIGADGSLVQSNITKKDSWDMGVNETEGCAFDPASGRIWISRESDTTIREFDLGSKEFVRSVPVPSVMKQIHSNRSLEALTISGDGKTMWTCNEEALQCDGDLATR